MLRMVTCDSCEELYPVVGRRDDDTGEAEVEEFDEGRLEEDEDFGC